jgi:hypothetical protein
MEMAQSIIRIDLRHSRIYALAFDTLHLLALVALLAPVWPWGLHGGGALLLVVHGWFRRLPHGGAAGLLLLRTDGLLEIAAEDGLSSYCERLDIQLVHPWLTVFAATVGGRRRSFVVLPDSLSADEFRQLRRWLHWRSQPLSDASVS